MRYGDYIPEPDAEAALWMDAFARGLAQEPSTYGVAPSTAAMVRQVVDRFLAALVRTAPEMRNSASVTAKVEARVDAQNLCRSVAQQIKLNAGVSNPAKTALGIRPPNIARTPIAPPSTSPTVNVVAATPGVHNLVYHDSMIPTRRARPFGAAALQLYKYVSQPGDAGEDAPAPRIDVEAEARFVGLVTRTPFEVKHGPGEVGRRITYWGRWVSRRGETGPWSLAASMFAA